MANPRPPRSAPPVRSAAALLGQLRASDLRGAARIATQATTEVTHIAEGVHRSVLGSLGLSGDAQPGRAGGLTGMVYQGIRGVVFVQVQATMVSQTMIFF